MNLLTTAAFMLKEAAETTAETAAETIAPIVTEYSDEKIPAITLAALTAFIVILIAFGVADFAAFKKRSRNFGMGVLGGFSGYLISYMGFRLIIQALAMIPSVADALSNNLTAAVAAQFFMSICSETAAIALGLKFLLRSSEKKGTFSDLGTPMAFGFAMYLVVLMLNQELTNCIQYIMVGTVVNDQGFDYCVTEMVQSGSDQEEAIESMLIFVRGSWFSYIQQAMFYVFRCIQQTAAAMLCYGCLKGMIPKKWMWAGFGGLLLLYIPGTLSYFVNVGDVTNFIIDFIIVALQVYMTRRILMTYMKDEFERFWNNRNNAASKRGKDSTPAKMPKIKMPD